MNNHPYPKARPDAEPPELLLDAAVLAAPVRARLGSPQATVTAGAAERLSRQGQRTVYSVTGTAQEAAGVRPWDLVLKVIAPPRDPAAHPPTVWHYWEREARVYQSGILADLPGGVRAAQCYGVEQRPEGAYWLWLEPFAAFHTPWPRARYGLAAEHFGRFNGAYLAGRPLPRAPWLAPDTLRSRLADRQPGWARVRDPATWTDPRVRHAFPVPLADRCQALAARRDAWLARLAQMPQTFCHLDGWRGNLVAGSTPDGQPATIAIDWALCGYAPPGQEIAALVWVTLLELLLDGDQAAALEEEVLARYLAGLHQAGWRGDERAVRFAYLAHALLLWGMVPETLDYLCDPEEGAWAAAHWGRPLAEIGTASAAAIYALMARLPEADRLFAALG